MLEQPDRPARDAANVDALELIVATGGQRIPGKDMRSPATGLA